MSTELDSTTKSKLNDCFNSHEDILKGKPCIKLADRLYTVDDIEPHLRNLPICSAVPKLPVIKADAPAMNRHMQQFKKCLQRLPKLDTSIVIDFVLNKRVDGIRLYREAIQKDKKGNMSLLPPRFTIDLEKFRHQLGDEIANTGVRINTGYIITIPKMTMTRKMENCKITCTNTFGIQHDIVLLPLIMKQPYDDIVPTVFGRDPDDTGLFTLHLTFGPNFKWDTVPDPKKRIMAFTIEAFTVKHTTTELSIHPADDADNTKVNLQRQMTDAMVFKPKDLKYGRYIRNPKLPIDWTTWNTQLAKNSLVMDVRKDSKPKWLKITDTITLMLSRKREWCEPNAITLPGLFSPTDASACIRPMSVYLMDQENTKNEPIPNTHCLATVTGKLAVFSTETRYEDYKASMPIHFINGAFYDMEHFKMAHKSTHNMYQALHCLKEGAKSIMRMCQKKNHFDNIEHMLLMFDHHHTIDENIAADAWTVTDEKEMFSTKPGSAKSAYSVMLYKAMLKCIDIFMHADLSPQDQIFISNATSIKHKASVPAVTTVSGKSIAPSTATSENTSSGNGGDIKKDASVAKNYDANTDDVDDTVNNNIDSRCSQHDSKTDTTVDIQSQVPTATATTTTAPGTPTTNSNARCKRKMNNDDGNSNGNDAAADDDDSGVSERQKLKLDEPGNENK